MRRQPALAAEVGRRRHQAASEQLRPGAVDDHPRRQRMPWRREPARQAEPVGRQVLRERAERRRRAGLDRLGRRVVGAAGQHEGLARLGAIAHRHHLDARGEQRVLFAADAGQRAARGRRRRIDAQQRSARAARPAASRRRAAAGVRRIGAERIGDAGQRLHLEPRQLPIEDAQLVDADAVEALVAAAAEAHRRVAAAPVLLAGRRGGCCAAGDR